MLEPIATIPELSEQVGEPIAEDDTAALAMLRGASARVRAYTRREWTREDAPDEVHAVVLQVAERKWRNPEGFIQDTTGPFTTRLPERAGDGIYLTADERDTLDWYRATRLSLWAQPTTRGPVETLPVARHTYPYWEVLR